MDQEIDLASLLDNPDRPRLSDDPEALKDLAASIGLVGLLQPITVFKLPAGPMIEDGHRRRKACLLAGITKAVCRVVDAPPDRQTGKLRQYHASEFAEKHTNREKLAFVADYRTSNPGCTGAQIATALGVTPGMASRFVALLDAPAAVREAVENGLALEVGYEVSRADDPLAALQAHLSKAKPKRGRKPKDEHSERVKRITCQLGTATVTVVQGKLDLAGFISTLRALLKQAKDAEAQGVQIGMFSKLVAEQAGKAGGK